MKSFFKKVDDSEISVGVIGLGYVGLPLVREFVSNGITTIGFDIDTVKIEKLNSGSSYIKHFSDGDISMLFSGEHFTATEDFEQLIEADAVIICVPTPLKLHREPDLSYVESTMERVAKTLRPGQLIVLESTTYPGTTDEVVLPILEKSGLKCGTDFYLAFSPEREDPGNPDFTTKSIPKVIGGYCRESLMRAEKLYGKIVDQTVPVSSTATAEGVKILENIFRSVNIALVNELKVIYSKMGIDIWEVIEAASTKPFGFMPFYPGPGLGGHCIPIDPFYLSWKAHEFGVATRFIELAGEINSSMPSYVIDRLLEALNERGLALKGSSILVMGLAYKADVDDIRESPSLKLLDILTRYGAHAHYHDPYVLEMVQTRKYPEFFGMKSVELSSESIASYDAVLIATAHSNVDYTEVVKHARLIVDTRNVTRNISGNRDNIVTA